MIGCLSHLRGPASRRSGFSLRRVLCFRLYFSVVVLIAAVWLVVYAVVVAPCLGHHGDERTGGLTVVSEELVVQGVCVLLGRGFMCIPRVFTWLSRTRCACGAMCLYAFCVVPLLAMSFLSIRIWIVSLACLACTADPTLYRAIRLHAIGSNLVNILFLAFACWQDKHLSVRRATADALGKLPTRPYDEGLFGEAAGMPYPSACPICLVMWTAEDVIKETPCGHLFHEDCLRSWCEISASCPMCRLALDVRYRPARPEPGWVPSLAVRTMLTPAPADRRAPTDWRHAV